MAFCPKCGAQVEDGAPFCAACGTNLAGGQTFTADPWDHTAEFDSKDISDNKCFALLPYLLGTLGIIIVALVANASPYAKFHLRQAVKFVVVNTILTILCALLFWTILVPIAAGVCFVIVFVLKVIVVFQIFGGKAVEPSIIRGLKFLA